MTTSIFHIVRMISIYPMHTSPNTNSKGLGMLYVNSVKHIGEPTKCCHKWHNKHGGESNLEQCVQETIENLGLKTKKRTCGTAILSRLAAQGIGTSAPAILSTGASRYSKLSSKTDMLQQKCVRILRYYTRACVERVSKRVSGRTISLHQSHAGGTLLQQSPICWSS